MRVNVDVKRAPNFRFVLLQQRTTWHDAGIVDEDRDAADGRFDAGDERENGGAIGDIATKELIGYELVNYLKTRAFVLRKTTGLTAFALDLLHRLLVGRCIDVDAHNDGAESGVLKGHLTTDAVAGAGDQNDFAGNAALRGWHH